MTSNLVTPFVRFLGVLLLAVVLTFAAISFSLQENNFNIEFKPGYLIQSQNGQIQIEKNDLMLEPGEFPTFTEYNNFFNRQEQLSKIISVNKIALNDGQKTIELSASKKSLSELALTFWLQIIVAVGALLISGWVWSLKPKNLATTLFFMSGLALALSAFSSAVYTSRTIALPALLFRILEYLNAIGAAFFGMAMVALFTVYPREVKFKNKLIAANFIFFTFWLFANLMQWTPDFASISLIIVTLMIFILVMIGVQYFITKNDPKSRAILVWLGLSVLVGAGFFVGFNTLPVVFGLDGVDQGYAFLSFLIIYIGLALGLKQYRLFDVGSWAFKFLFYAAGTFLLVAIDAVLVFVASINQVSAFGISLALVGFCYLPLRDYIWRLFKKNTELKPHELLHEALQVAFAPTLILRTQRWEDLIKKIFNPLEMSSINSKSDVIQIDPNGTELILPPVVGISAYKIVYPWLGKALFNTQSIQTVKQVILFIKEAENSRQAYDRGVAEERQRIAQDLHDDVSARLLTGLHSEHADLRSTIKESMADIRTIIKGIAGEKVKLNDVLADLRIENLNRTRIAKISLNWNTVIEETNNIHIDYRVSKSLSSIIREIVSNAIKHSKSGCLSIEISIINEILHLKAFDNGCGFPEEIFQGQTGFGLKNIRQRLSDLSGSVSLKNMPHAMIEIKFPIA